MKEKISLKGISDPAFLSLAIKSGNFIFISGQGPKDLITGEIHGKTIEEQAAYTIDNIFYILNEANIQPTNIVKINTYLSNINDYDKYNKVYCEKMPDPKPARTTVGADLVGILVEIDCIACID